MLKKVSLYGIIAVLGVSPAIADQLPVPTGLNGDVYRPEGEYVEGTCGAPILGNNLNATSVTMSPQFVPLCPAGQYLVVPGANGEIAECSPCSQNSYCGGMSALSWNNDGTLSTQGIADCPADYPSSTGGVNATDINACYKTCDNNVTLPHAISCSPASATVSYGNYCDVTCSGCANGYNNNKNLNTIMANATASVNSLTGDITIAATEASLTGKSFCEETSGAATYDCRVRITGLTQGNIDADLNASGSVIVATGYADLASCEANCPAGKDVDGTSDINYASYVTSLVSTVGTKTICLPNVVTITWTGIANPGNAGSCEFSGTLNVPGGEPVSERPAYCGQDGTGCTFLGWKVAE